jgi:hypothetical protein
MIMPAVSSFAKIALSTRFTIVSANPYPYHNQCNVPYKTCKIGLKIFENGHICKLDSILFLSRNPIVRTAQSD